MGQYIPNFVTNLFRSSTPAEQQKDQIKQAYGQVATQAFGKSCCSGGGGNCNKNTNLSQCINIFSENYSQQEGYIKEADLGVGCGIPTTFANLQPGETVLDLGSGAGNDCFLARKAVGESGQVYGLDMTAEMVQKAKENLASTGYTNVEFVLGEIESMPFDSNTIDVIISNCVINLVPSKAKAFSEVLRVLKPDGRLCVSDVVLSKELPPNLKKSAMLMTGCVANAMVKEEYLKLMEQRGFAEVKIHKQREILLSDEILSQCASKEDIEEYRKSGTQVFSITVSAYKRTQENEKQTDKFQVSQQGKKIQKKTSANENSNI